jgi:hypothetical protein
MKLEEIKTSLREVCYNQGGISVCRDVSFVLAKSNGYLRIRSHDQLNGFYCYGIKMFACASLVMEIIKHQAANLPKEYRKRFNEYVRTRARELKK